jgi:adenylate cyclase
MHFRIGLNSGPAKVGFMGTENLASYTMMGDTVNLAARLEAAGKDYGVEILVSEMTKNKIKDEMFLRQVDAVRVKGKAEPVLIYELIGKMGDIPQNIIESVGLYNEAFNLYRQCKWDEAIAKFNESGKARGALDKSAKLLISRCLEYKDSPPPENWDGVFTRTHK